MQIFGIQTIYCQYFSAFSVPLGTAEKTPAPIFCVVKKGRSFTRKKYFRLPQRHSLSMFSFHYIEFTLNIFLLV